MRAIPAVHRILSEPGIEKFEDVLGREEIKRAVEQVLDRVRASGQEQTHGGIIDAVARKLNELALQTLSPVINATGIILHTNLGRAPLAAEALAAVDSTARGYSNLEYDLAAGERGSRYSRISGVLNDVTGAEDSLVVNNCAAAVLLVLDTFAKGRDVVVGRNQLIEIGGGFRIPEVLERSGATLVEAGTTNRVYVEDYERALSPRTALLLRTHPSNYRIEGFIHEPTARELVELGRRAGVLVVEDLGSGALVDLAGYGVGRERTVQDALSDGIGLVTFSGDKLLGGPQAGIIVGRDNLIARLRNNPLLRALRVDKMTLAALAATLRLYRDGCVREAIPIYRMLAANLKELRLRAEAYLIAIPGAIAVESDAYVGGGALPQARAPSIAVAIAVEKPDPLAARLRGGKPPIVARIEDDRVLLDLRTIAPEDDDGVIAAVTRTVQDL
ncbi:MAG TPA: L-seryl-tRNA(Sec) selenium transferase [Candidatus Cybelea sp.]|jgi:L-seryl-tRNA(Ser) seleniumtransferase|nr:L-seryl-tRNA(Sec) selenium transferase [Candidatus Cybelea sp.]